MHGHNCIVEAIGLPFRGMRFNDPEFSWHCAQGGGLDLVGLDDGYIPDLIVLDRDLDAEAAASHLLVPDQVELVVEVTSKSNAVDDRRPETSTDKRDKWCGYAKVGVPYYLLVDRDPKVGRTTLYSIPDATIGAYLEQQSWAFGEKIVLPEHFGVEISTAEWLTWDAP